MRKFLISLSIAVAAIGCAKQRDIDSVDPSGLRQIQLGSGIASQVQTKASYNGDVAITGLQFLRKDSIATPLVFTGISAISGERAVGGTVVFGTTQSYVASGNTYFASYYPAGTVAQDSVVWAIDGKTDILTADIVDAGTNATPNAVASLAYEHQLAQVEVICAAAAGKDTEVKDRWGNITGIQMSSTPTTMRYAYRDLSVTVGPIKGNIALLKPGYADIFEAMAVPASTNTEVNAAGMFAPSTSQIVALEVTTVTGGTKTVKVDLGTGNQLQRAHKHVITLTFQPPGVMQEIVVGSSIEAWSTGATGSGNVN